MRAEIAPDDPAGRDLAKDIAEVEIDLMALEATEAANDLAIVARQRSGPGCLAPENPRHRDPPADCGSDAPRDRPIWLALREHPAGGNVFVPGPQYAHTATEKYLNTRKLSIYGGSNEIQRNIIAKAVLGL